MPFTTSRARAAAALVLITLAAGTTAATAQADEFNTAWVDKDSTHGQCDDSVAFASNTINHPWCTIDKALDAAPEGADVNVLSDVSGSPYASVTISNRQRSQPLRFVGYGGVDNIRPVISSLVITGSKNFAFKNLAFNAGIEIRADSQQIQIRDSDISNKGIFVSSASTLIFNDNTFHDIDHPGINWKNVPLAEGYGIRINGAPLGALPGPAPTELFKPLRTLQARLQGLREALRPRPLPGLPISPLRNLGQLLRRTVSNVFPTPIANVEIYGNTFSGITIDPVQVSNADNVLVRRNVMTNNFRTDDAHADGVQVLGNVNNMLIEANRFISTQRGIIVGPDTQIGQAPPTNVRIVNNLMFHLKDFGVNITKGTDDVLLANNTMLDTGQEIDAGNQSAVIYDAGSGVTGTKLVNNIMRRLVKTETTVYAVEDHNMILQPYPQTAYGSHDVLGNLTNPGVDGETLRPLPGSPAVDAGTDQYGAPVIDIEGRPRYDDPSKANGAGGITDIGALEYGPGVIIDVPGEGSSDFPVIVPSP